MFPAGYAHFGYLYRELGSRPKVITTKVACGRGYLEEAIAEDLQTRRLKFPDGNLMIDREKRKIDVFRSLVLSPKGPSVFYSRLYTAQNGFKEAVASVDRILEKGDSCPLQDVYLSRQFEKYLVDNLDFIERAAFRPEDSASAEIETRVSFSPHREFGIPEPHIDCSICLSPDLMGEISEAYREIPVAAFHRQPDVLTWKKNPMTIERFLQAVDIQPASGKYESRRAYRNIKKCCAYLGNITFKDAISPYSTTFTKLNGRRDQK